MTADGTRFGNQGSSEVDTAKSLHSPGTIEDEENAANNGGAPSHEEPDRPVAW